MNVQKNETSTRNSLYIDDKNGNFSEMENVSKAEECNVKDHDMDCDKKACLDKERGNEARCTSRLPCPVALELQETVDYTHKEMECCISNLDSYVSRTSALTQPYSNTVELEETVDYINKEAFEMQNNLCLYPSLPQTCTQHKNQEPPSDFTNLHRIQDQNVNQSVPYMQKSIDTFLDKNATNRTSTLATTNTITNCCGNTAGIQETGTVYRNKPDSMEAAKCMANSSLSLFSFSSVFSDEMCMRKNSFVSSGSEKPLSASVLESSGLQNSSLDVSSGSIKLTSKLPDCGQCTEQTADNVHYLEVPQNRDSKDRPHKMSLTPENSVFVKDNSELQLNSITCIIPGVNRAEEPSPHPETVNMKSSDNLNANNNCALPCLVSSELRMEENGVLQTKDVNCLLVENTNSFQSPSIRPEELNTGPKDSLHAQSRENCDETFLVNSENSDVGSKAYTSTPLPESKNITFYVPAIEELAIQDTRQKASVVSDGGKGNGLDVFRASAVNGTPKPINRKLTVVTAAAGKFKKNEVISFPKPNFKNVKAKVLTRPGLQAKDSLSSASKISPRSPQSLSNASSPVASPKTPASSLKTVRKKFVLDQDVKAEAAIGKSQKQPINKQLFPSQVSHVSTHSKLALGKVPRTNALKHTQDDLDRASSSNSTRSSGSAAAVTCNASSRVTEKVKTFAKPATSNVEPMGPDKIQQNGIVDAPYERVKFLKHRKYESVSGDMFANTMPVSSKLSTPNSKNLHKELFSCVRNTTSQQVSAQKIKIQAIAQRRGSLSKNAVTVRVSSPPRGNQQAFVGAGLGFLKGEEQNTINAFPLNGTKSQPISRVPCRGAVLQRTPSLSSVCSTQSENSTRSTTSKNGIKTEEVSTKCMRQNCASEAQPSKFSSRNQSQSTRAAHTVSSTKKITTLNQGVAKSTVAKKAEVKLQVPVEKGKKTSPRGPVTQTPTPPVDLKAVELAQCKAVCEKQKGIIGQLKNLLTKSNQSFEALTVVIQQLISQHEDDVKKRKELSQELLNLRGDLVSASGTNEKLEKEKNDLLIAYEGILQKVKDEHNAELSGLEEKLKQFYTGECENLQSIFIKEADKYKNELQKKVDDLNSTQEASRQKAETSHTEAIETLKKEFENSLTELKNTQDNDAKLLEDTFKEKQAALEKKIDELKQENESLKEKLKFEDEQRKLSKDKWTQKNPQVMYLEQELESLKAVLEIKNEKLRQQDKKIMQIEKLVETNTTLVERLNKSQQENEDLKARMANHIALSRQLSTEQEALQRSLEKESKANKRLSLENEELLWKLHNGDLCSPKKLSPSSPAKPFHPSRNSGSFSSPAVSPR